MIIYSLNQELTEDMKSLHLFLCFSCFLKFFLGGGGWGDDFWKKKSCHQILIMLCSRVPFNTTTEITQTHKKPATFYNPDSRDAHPNTTMSVKLTHKGHLFHIVIQTGTWYLPSCWSWQVVHVVSYWSERDPCLLLHPLHLPPLHHH